MTPERLIAIAQAHGISLDSVGKGSKPSFTIAEVGLALAGMDKEEREPAYAAFAWKEIADRKQRSILYVYLCKEVFWGYSEAWRDSPDQVDWPLAERERWPLEIAGQRYQEKLIALALDEDRIVRHANEIFPLDPAHPMFDRLLAEKGLYGIGETLWKRRLSRKYVAIRHIILTWYASAWYHTWQRIHGDEDSEQ